MAISFTIAAQGIIPIPVDTTSVWRISRQFNDESCVYNHNSIYYINGTVTISGKEYYKVYEEGNYYESSVDPQYPCTGSYNYTGIFRGGIRTENGKTYGYTWGSPELLMDFTLNVGDTLFSSICQDGKVIESIDSVLVGDEYRKRFNFANSWYCNWMIEGVGHERGLFESMDDPFENWSELICYGENNVPLFGDGNCDITVGEQENKFIEDNVNIYPNPVSDKLHIDLLNNTANSYILTNVYGRLILKSKKTLLNNNEIIINLSKLKPGLYLLSLEIKNRNISTYKILKK